MLFPLNVSRSLMDSPRACLPVFPFFMYSFQESGDAPPIFYTQVNVYWVFNLQRATFWPGVLVYDCRSLEEPPGF